MKKEYYEEEGIIVSYHLLNLLTNYMNHNFDKIKKDIIQQELYRKVTFKN